MVEKASFTQDEKRALLIRIVALESFMIALLGAQEIQRPGYCDNIGRALDQRLGQEADRPDKEALIELRDHIRMLLDQVNAAYDQMPENLFQRWRRRLFGYPRRP